MLVLPAVLGSAACAKDYCKVKDQPRELTCKCQPKDDELLARLQPTELPYPIRKVVLRCADDLHRTAVPSLVTKQGLHDCVNADPSLDAATKTSVLGLIDRSNLIEQQNLQDWQTLCQAPAAAAGPKPAEAPAPAATPAPAPAAPAPAAAPPSG